MDFVKSPFGKHFLSARVRKPRASRDRFLSPPPPPVIKSNFSIPATVHPPRKIQTRKNSQKNFHENSKKISMRILKRILKRIPKRILKRIPKSIPPNTIQKEF